MFYRIDSVIGSAGIVVLWLVVSSSVAERHPTPPQEGAVKVNAKDGVTYVWIGAGTFTMGCSPGDNECFDDEKPASHSDHQQALLDRANTGDPGSLPASHRSEAEPI
jgi:hypothetical protein